jgi:hypothetical protein
VLIPRFYIITSVCTSRGETDLTADGDIGDRARTIGRGRDGEREGYGAHRRAREDKREKETPARDHGFVSRLPRLGVPWP